MKVNELWNSDSYKYVKIIITPRENIVGQYIFQALKILFLLSNNAEEIHYRHFSSIFFY